MLYRRVTGSLPAKVTDLGGLIGQLRPYPYPELRADHSTIATIENGRVGLEELPELWNELERCPDQPYLLLRNDWATESDVFIAPVFSDFSLFQPTPLPAIVEALFRLYAEKKIRPVIYRRYRLEEVAQALAALGSRQTYGKVVLAP